MGRSCRAFTEGNKGNKESQLLPWSFVSFVAFCKMFWIGCGSAEKGDMRDRTG
jgi:hypothetical protein